MDQLLQMRGEGVGSYSSFDETEVEYFRYQFTKSYLNSLFQQRTTDSQLQILRLLARDSGTAYRLRPLTVRDSGDEAAAFVMDDSIEATVLFRDKPYEVAMYRYREPYTDKVHYLITALGLSEQAKAPTALIRSLIREALQHSPFKNKFLMIGPSEEHAGASLDVKIAEIERSSLADVFLTDALRESLHMFIECLGRFVEIGQPLRYLLSGRPGTAKTKIIRAIANEAQGKATFIFTNGSDHRVDAVFELAECFSPVVVCIDDVDLLVGSRERTAHRQALAQFLQRLDGFTSSGVFVLATTNDKMLVDMAASRPGRFDLVLDVGPIDSKCYGDLIESKTDSAKVLALFNEHVVAVLESRKVTGAFLATLVKHLEIVDKLGYRDIDHDYVMNIIQRMNGGFYKEAPLKEDAVGFSAS
jgi:cell division protease FtsH